MRAQTQNDIVIATGRGVAGVPVPDALQDLPIARLRFDGESVIDAASRSRFAIDGHGRKHLPEVADPSWPLIDCHFDAVVYRDDRGAWVASTTGVTPGDARRERDRRMAIGAAIPVTGIADPIPVQGGVDDRANLAGLGLRAQRRLAAGDTTPMRFRGGDDVVHHLSPAQMAEMVERGMEWVEAVHDVVWSWKEAGEVPADYTDDAYWPQRS